MRQMRCGRRCLALFIACLLALLGLSHAGAALAEGGVLADLAPTMLDLLGLEQPEEMTGHSLIVK